MKPLVLVLVSFVVGIAGSAGSAGRAAADLAPVNLLTAVPTTVAVSSTVANAKILPEHLVDGDLRTAWNSRTGELVGAWIAVRLPADAKLTRLKLTAGFTKQDKKLGDLFTENPRIKRVRVSHDGKPVLDQVLDPGNRGLQELPITGGGGDYKIEVLEIVNGSKPTWRETCVSELEVWGLPGPSAAKLSGKQKPVVQIGTLEPLPVLSEADCVRLLFPAAHGRHIADDDQAGGVEVLPIGRDTFVCHVIHGEAVDQPEGDKQHEVAVVAGKRRAVLAGRVSETTTGSHDDSTMIVETGAFAAALVPLTATETALLVEISRGRGGPMLSDSVTSSTLYRITKTGLDPVLAFKSSRVGGESSDDDVCVLQVGKPRAPLPDVDLQCTKTEGRWHHEDPRGDGLFDEVRTEHYRWDGTRYARR